jgi:hypothetical protein
LENASWAPAVTLVTRSGLRSTAARLFAAPLRPPLEYVRQSPAKNEYRGTQSTPLLQMHADPVADDLSEREEALRKLPLPYSLALRLRDAGVAREVICEYVGVEDASLDGVYRIAEAKLMALQK